MNDCGDLTLWVNNSNYLELNTLTDSVTGAPITDATVTATIYDQAGVELPGQAWPISLPHDTGGTYRGAVEPTLEITAGKHYRATVLATATGLSGRWNPICKAVTRGDT